MLFKDVIGHSAIKAQFIQRYQNGKMPHAIMLAGKDGHGTLPLALALTQYLMCANKQADDACGTCSSCVKNAKLEHPDVGYTFPIVKEGKTEKCSQVVEEWRKVVTANPYVSDLEWVAAVSKEGKRGLITVEVARELLNSIVLKSFEGSYRVQVIWHAESMNPQAANAILKALEEPPAKTFFILVCPDIEQLMPTIISRVQTTVVPALMGDEVTQYLVEKQNIEQDVAESIAGISEGSISNALRLCGQDGKNWLFSTFLEWARCTFKNHSSGLLELFAVLEKMSKDRQVQFFEYGLFIFRQAILFQYTGDKSLTLRGEEKKWLTEKFYPFANEKNIISLQELFSEAIADIERNVNFRLVLLDVSYRTFRILRPAKELA